MKTDCKTVKKNIDRFLRQHKSDLRNIDVVVGVSRGGLIPAVFIATAIDKPLVTVYIDREDRVYLDRAAWIKSKRVLLVDDIVRTGSTFKKMLALLKRHHPKSLKSFTLFCLRAAHARPTWTTMISTDRLLPWD
jgi:adenine/guanine phosphoribosyltransferase-like PRPP-binding protein